MNLSARQKKRSNANRQSMYYTTVKVLTLNISERIRFLIGER
jgi:hypothetical protein